MENNDNSNAVVPDQRTPQSSFDPKSIWSTMKEGKYTIGLTVGDIGAKVYTANHYAPRLKAAGNNSAIHFSPSTGNTTSSGANNLLNNAAPIVQLESTTDSIGYVEATSSPSCDVSRISYGLILQEVLGSGIIVIVQVYSIEKIWKELIAVGKAIKASKEAIASIERDIQVLVNAVEKLNEMLDEIKDKSEEQVTLDEIRDLLDEVTETSILCRKVYRPICESIFNVFKISLLKMSLAKLQIDVGGNIQTLTANKSLLVKDGILSSGQVVAHLVEFSIYASCPMGVAFWTVKKGFTLVFAGITAVKAIQYAMTSDRLEQLQQMWRQLEVYDNKLAEIDESLLVKVRLLKNMKEKSKQTKKCN